MMIDFPGFEFDKGSFKVVFYRGLGEVGIWPKDTATSGMVGYHHVKLSSKEGALAIYKMAKGWPMDKDSMEAYLEMSE